MPEISIILPVYNSQKYIFRCLKALQQQSFKDIEILCVDDGSTDQSVKLLKNFAAKDERFRLFFQKNKGPGPARNLALTHARGKYIMFCDSDDYYDANICQLMKDSLEKEQTDAVCCDCILEEEDTEHGRTQNDISSYKLNFQGKLILNNTDRLKINVFLWNKIFKKTLIDKYCITFPATKEHDDLAFVRQYLFIAKNIFGLKQGLYHYCLHSSSLMATLVCEPQKANRWNLLEAWRHLAHFIIRIEQWQKARILLATEFWNHLAFLQKCFHWSNFSDGDLDKFSYYLNDLPLMEKDVPIMQTLYWLKQKKFNKSPRTALNLDIRYYWAKFLPCYRKLTSPQKKRIFIFGLEIYKEDLLTGTKRFLGFLKTTPSDH